MDYFGGKLVSVDQQFGDLNTGIGKQKINSEHLEPRLMPCKLYWVQWWKITCLCILNGKPRNTVLKVKMGKFRARASDTHIFANKTLHGVWGLSFQASAEDDSGLLLKELELILPRRLLNLGHSLPRRSWQFSVPAESSLSRTWWTASKSLLVSHKAKRARWGSPKDWRTLFFPVRTSLQSPREIISAAEERPLKVRMVWIGALEGKGVLGGSLLSAELPAASSAQLDEKSLPRDLAVVLSTGKLYKLHAVLLSKSYSWVLVQYPDNCFAVRVACFPFLLTVIVLGNRLLLLFSDSIWCEFFICYQKATRRCLLN